MLYALIDAADAVLRFQDFDAPPPALAPEKGLRWLEVEDVRPEPGEGEVSTGPVVAVEAGGLRRVWGVAAAPPPPVPAVVGMAQARVALARAGLSAAVEAAAAAAGDETVTAWEYATEVRRDSILVAALADALGLTATETDALFTAAADVRF